MTLYTTFKEHCEGDDDQIFCTDCNKDTLFDDKVVLLLTFPFAFQVIQLKWIYNNKSNTITTSMKLLKNV